MIPVALAEVAAKVWAKIAKPLAVVLCILLVVAGIWFYGYTKGQASRQDEINDLADKLSTAKAQVTALADAARRQNEENEKALRQAEEARQEADQAKTRLGESEAARRAAEAAFADKLNSAAKRPECASLKEMVCEAVPFPY